MRSLHIQSIHKMSLIPSGKSCKYITFYGIEYHHLIDYILHVGLKIYIVVI